MVKTLLNVGAGHRSNQAALPKHFRGPDWREIRVDINPNNDPDILGSMLHMPGVEPESIDAVFSSHSIEHLYPEEIPIALQEFLRVLKSDGVVVINCPDIQAAAELIAQDKLLDTAYMSPSGIAVTPFDMVYSHRSMTGRDKPFMAHHCGFTLSVLRTTMIANGFGAAAGGRGHFDLWVVASKASHTDESIENLATLILKG